MIISDEDLNFLRRLFPGASINATEYYTESVYRRIQKQHPELFSVMFSFDLGNFYVRLTKSAFELINPGDKTYLIKLLSAESYENKLRGWYSLSDYIEEMEITKLIIYRNEFIEFYSEDSEDTGEIFEIDAWRSNKKSIPITEESLKDTNWCLKINERSANRRNTIFLITMTKSPSFLTIPSEMKWIKQLRNLRIEFTDESFFYGYQEQKAAERSACQQYYHSGNYEYPDYISNAFEGDPDNLWNID